MFPAHKWFCDRVARANHTEANYFSRLYMSKYEILKTLVLTIQLILIKKRKKLNYVTRAHALPISTFQLTKIWIQLSYVLGRLFFARGLAQKDAGGDGGGGLERKIFIQGYRYRRFL